MRQLISIVLLALPLAAGAQSGTINPGMNRAQVVAALGEPATARAANEFTYLFYRNDCGKACGMNDLVVLRSDSVIDAIFRSPSRRYTGTSSSPSPLTRGEAREGVTASRPMAMPAMPEQAIPLKKEVPAAPAAPVATAATTNRVAPTQGAKLVAPTPEERAKLRRELLGGGLTSTQIRARLRAMGYAEDALDADMRGAAAQAAPKMKPGPANDTRPSIPANEPPVRPAPAAPTSTRPPAP